LPLSLHIFKPSKPLKYKNMTAGLDDSNLHKGNSMNNAG